MSNTQQAARRDFLKTSGVLAAGTALASSLRVGRSAHAAGTDEIRVALIGCGGRGRGAAKDRIQVGDNVKIVAVADAFEDAARVAVNAFRKDEDIAAKLDLPDDRIFSGMDCHKKAIDCLRPGDQVLIATPPGFRPFQFQYAVEKGMHVFMEKPLFTDAPGYRLVMETAKKADEKGLKVAVGLQRRYEPQYQNWMQKIAEGAIGDVSFSRVYWNGGGIWCRERKPEQTELEFQLYNWYHFVWLCGDNICEQHVHNLDIGLWAHGKGDKMFHPVAANAQGGRQNPSGPLALLQSAPPFSDKDEWFKWYKASGVTKTFNRHGQAWDHFFVEYEFADGSRMFSQCRHIGNCWNSVDEHVHGTSGFGKAGVLYDRSGKEVWRNTEKAKKGPYQWEHDVLVDCIRNDKPRNDTYYSAMATMTAVMGREAAFNGNVIRWDDFVAKGKAHSPVTGIWDWNADAPVMPDANGFYESSVPKQGQYKWQA